MSESIELNRANWDDRAPAHAASPGYALERFVTDRAFLSHVVRFDRPRLGDIHGQRAVHLQCHIGTDTISLSRLGAQVTGLDFSAASLEEARAMARGTHTDIEFVQAEVYDALDVLRGGAFDLVYTGIGALCWLPDIDRWAQVVAGLLRPGGRLFIREGHPMLWALDETRAEAGLVVGYPYFQTDEPLIFEGAETYVETDRPLTHTTTHEWNHGLGEIVTALLARDLEVTALEEHQSVPWEALPGLMIHDPDDDEWRLVEHRERLPLTYTLQARRRA